MTFERILGSRSKLLIWIMGLASAGLCLWAWLQPMWGWYLSAPQYPHGLVLSVYMDHVAGDTTEINILNHYIGMAKLEEAAQFERSIAGYGIVLIAASTVMLVVLPGRLVGRILAIPSFSFPFIFVGAMYWWMYRFGHELSPSAPVSIEPFTPTLVGKGQIGNFSTIGMPGPGFYMVLIASVLTVGVYVLREKFGGVFTR